MKESISNALVLTLVITFLFIFVILFSASTAYTKAFKVKNKIISIIEKRENTVAKSGITSSIIDEIEAALGEVGYRVVINNDVKCEEDFKKRFKNMNYTLVNVKSNSYRYCIAEFINGTKESHGRKEMLGKYYAVVTYMYFEIPLLGKDLEFPVYGETKTIGITY